MRRRLAAVLAAVSVTLVVPAVASAVPPGLPASESASQPVYLALGDSVAAGAGAPAGEGYVPLLAGKLQLPLVDLSRGGATTASLLEQQLPAALELLAQRNADADSRNDVEVITLTVGGNDAFTPIVQACIPDASTATCQQVVQQVLGTYAANLKLILSQLRAAAGEDTTIVTTAYYNPLAACHLSAYVALGDVVLEGGGGVQGLNEITRQVSALYTAEVADAFGQLALEDYVGGQDCLHPDASGHAALADIFAKAILDAAPDAHVQDLQAACEGLTDDTGFTDVGSLNPATRAAINCLAAYGITQGRAPDAYAPRDAVKRYEIAIFLARVLSYVDVADTGNPDIEFTFDPSRTGFQDLGGVPPVGVDAINVIANADIARGRTPTAYDPFAPVSRRDMATFINRIQDAIGEQVPGAAYDSTHATKQFDDVPAGMPRAEDVYALEGAGIVQGTSVNTYKPFAPVVRSEMAFFIMRHLNENMEAGRLLRLPN